MQIINNIFSLVHSNRLTQIDRFRSNPKEVQSEQLNYLLTRAADTEFGRKYDIKTIKSADEQRLSVRIRDYDSLMSEVIRRRHGVEDLLWHREIKYFGRSSGSRSYRCNFIPVSQHAPVICDYQG